MESQPDCDNIIVNTCPYPSGDISCQQNNIFFKAVHKLQQILLVDSTNHLSSVAQLVNASAQQLNNLNVLRASSHPCRVFFFKEPNGSRQIPPSLTNNYTNQIEPLFHFFIDNYWDYLFCNMQYRNMRFFSSFLHAFSVPVTLTFDSRSPISIGFEPVQ